MPVFRAFCYHVSCSWTVDLPRACSYLLAQAVFEWQLSGQSGERSVHSQLLQLRRSMTPLLSPRVITDNVLELICLSRVRRVEVLSKSPPATCKIVASGVIVSRAHVYRGNARGS